MTAALMMLLLPVQAQAADYTLGVVTPSGSSCGSDGVSRSVTLIIRAPSWFLNQMQVSSVSTSGNVVAALVTFPQKDKPTRDFWKFTNRGEKLDFPTGGDFYFDAKWECTLSVSYSVAYYPRPYNPETIRMVQPSRTVSEYNTDSIVWEYAGDDPQSNTPPSISTPGDQTVQQGGRFDRMDGVTASDKEDGDLTGKIQVEGDVDVDVPGSYTVTYSVSDSGGLSATASRVIKVEAAGGGGTTIACAPQTGVDPAVSLWQVSAVLLGLVSFVSAGVVLRFGRRL